MTELYATTYTIPAASLGPENPLPQFRAATEDTEVKVSEDFPPEDAARLGWKVARRVLPYRLQDSYDRVKTPRDFRALVLENEHIRATFLPELGGRLASLVSKPEDRELLERNPVFQPVNIALRNAWFSGGIEWNASHLGHYYLTCSPVFAARVDGLEGEPVLRIYEWDRVKCFPWQIDFSLPPGSRFLFARMRIVNPFDSELPMYWWTNIAVPERAGTRVIVPAESAITNVAQGEFGLLDLPLSDGVDVTYPTNHRRAREMFFKVPSDARRWVAALDESGSGFVETSTTLLRGRKMFVWGMSQGGRRWQEYLASPESNYLEIQAGLARTQIECVPMPARVCWTWTEAFGLLESDPTSVHSDDWRAARDAAAASLEAVLPQSEVEDLHIRLEEVTTRQPAELLHSGSGWGALERRRLVTSGEEDRIPPELVFGPDTLGADQEPWLALLREGSLPERAPTAEPGHYMIQPQWRDLLEEAVRGSKGDTWLSWLHLGVMRMEAFDAPGAAKAWKESLKRTSNGWALRNLAALEKRSENTRRACDLLQEAWQVGPHIAPLAAELAACLLELGQWESVRQFADALPADLRANERIALSRAAACLELGDPAPVKALFEREFTTVREGEITLTQLWYRMHELRIAAEENVPVDKPLRLRVRQEFPPPRNIDFRMFGQPGPRGSN